MGNVAEEEILQETVEEGEEDVGRDARGSGTPDEYERT